MNGTGSGNKYIKALNESVRPLVTLIFSASAAFGWIYGKMSDDAFVGFVGIVIGFWFQQRQSEKAAAATTAAVTAAVLAEKKNGEKKPALPVAST